MMDLILKAGMKEQTCTVPDKGSYHVHKIARWLHESGHPVEDIPIEHLKHNFKDWRKPPEEVRQAASDFVRRCNIKDPIRAKRAKEALIGQHAGLESASEMKLRVRRSRLRPIITVRHPDGKITIADGFHRTVKAIRTKQTHVKGYVIDRETRTA